MVRPCLCQGHPGFVGCATRAENSQISLRDLQLPSAGNCARGAWSHRIPARQRPGLLLALGEHPWGPGPGKAGLGRRQRDELKGARFKVCGENQSPSSRTLKDKQGLSAAMSLMIYWRLIFCSGEILNLPWGGGEEVGNNLLK